MSPHSTYLRALFCSIAACFIAIPGALAQFNASITGTIRDLSGGRVPEAKITIKNAATNRSQSVTSGSDGVYRISALPPG